MRRAEEQLSHARRRSAKQITGLEMILLDHRYHSCVICKEFDPAWEKALAMIKASKVLLTGAAHASEPVVITAS